MPRPAWSSSRRARTEVPGPARRACRRRGGGAGRRGGLVSEEDLADVDRVAQHGEDGRAAPGSAGLGPVTSLVEPHRERPGAMPAMRVAVEDDRYERCLVELGREVAGVGVDVVAEGPRSAAPAAPGRPFAPFRRSPGRRWWRARTPRTRRASGPSSVPPRSSCRTARWQSGRRRRPRRGLRGAGRGRGHCGRTGRLGRRGGGRTGRPEPRPGRGAVPAARSSRPTPGRRSAG